MSDNVECTKNSDSTRLLYAFVTHILAFVASTANTATFIWLSELTTGISTAVIKVSFAMTTSVEFFDSSLRTIVFTNTLQEHNLHTVFIMTLCILGTSFFNMCRQKSMSEWHQLRNPMGFCRFYFLPWLIVLIWPLHTSQKRSVAYKLHYFRLFDLKPMSDILS